MHISSLPGKFGVGDFGPEAFKFADFLQKSRQAYWQILPISPPNRFIGWSPYDCLSAFAGNTMLISPELLYKSGLLDKNDLADVPRFSPKRVEFKKVYDYKLKLLNKAFAKFNAHGGKEEFMLFCRQNSFWLNDYSVFVALMEKYKSPDWWKWPKTAICNELKQSAYKEKVFQYLFFTQWNALKDYCNIHGIKIIGDIPIYVSYRSSDVWSHPEIFKLKNKKLLFKAGVPPDYFSKTGQLWGNPIYNWDVLKKTDYQWWMERIRHNLNLFDMVRIDHFRGLVKYWQIPADEKTAVNGKWMPGPGEEFFRVLFKNFPNAKLLAEDLGFITPDVRNLIKKLNLTSMKILLFAFGDDRGKSVHYPHNYTENCFVYTGTHDNNTIKGWFRNEVTPEKRKNIFRYLGKKISVTDLNWELIRLAMASVARTAVFPMQDILNLDAENRMNNPARRRGNWQWRLMKGQITVRTIDKLADMTKFYGRAFC